MKHGIEYELHTLKSFGSFSGMEIIVRVLYSLYKEVLPFYSRYAHCSEKSELPLRFITFPLAFVESRETFVKNLGDAAFGIFTKKKNRGQ